MRRPRVLIVDDQVLNIELAAFVLRNADFEVACASSARQALAQVQAFRPELILMDIQLPDIDGLALTQQFKADPATRHMVVVAFTAYAMKGDEARMRDAGCDGYISKPIDVATFADTVRAMLPRHGSAGPPLRQG